MQSHNEQEYLAAKFDRHADEEGKILDEYRTLSEKLGNSSVGNLVSHILTEEELHHLLLRTLAKWLRERPSEQDRAIPSSANRAELLRLTQTLQQHERDTIDACRSLRAKVVGQRAELVGPLLDAMVLDSEKHRQLLAVVENMLKTGC